MMLLTADCIPVAIARADGGRLAVLHAGWRGLEAGIVEAGAEAVGGEIVGAVGPGAGPCCYEVATTSPRRCRRASARTSCATGGPTCGCAPGARSRRPARSRWRSPASARICNPDRYFSHRRDRGVTGRQGRGGGAAWLTRRSIAANLARIRAQVGPGVEILAATKYVDAGRPAGAAARPASRWSARTAPTRWPPSRRPYADLFTWDFIGHVQSRKVRDIVGRVRLIHAVDSLSACEQLERRREPGATVDCLLQVNVASEDTKSGVAPAERRRVPGGGRAARAACGSAA